MPDEAREKEEQRHKNIEDVLRAREELDDILNKNFRKRVAILFSDVCGYTQFMDSRGDISGRAWIQKHNNMVYPLINEQGGKILSEMGDGIMVAFPDSLAAVKASVEVQKALFAYNQKTDPADEIHVTMGINTGDILMDEEHIAGDVVNVASRIETSADRDQILIAKSTYEDVRGSEDVLCRYNGPVAVKGKSKPLELYRVVWQDEEMFVSDEPQIRIDQVAGKTRAPSSSSCLRLEVTREEDRLNISAYEQSPGETTTVMHYEELPVSMSRVQERSLEIVETLNNANRKGRLDREVLRKLRDIGQVFRDELLTSHVKETVSNSESSHLILHIDDQLVQVPWELLHDGKQFLCQRFSMGRVVKTRQNVFGGKTRLLARPLKMLVLADPKGDLKGAYKEGTEIRDYMDQEAGLIDVSLLSSGVTPGVLQEKVRNFDMVHYAGHAEYNDLNPKESGWKLSEGVLKGDEIIRMSGTASMPALIFSNACQSARTEEWAINKQFQHEIYGLANAFILAGVKHFIGTFWEILDEPSRKYALAFYKHLFSGMTIGEATRQARLDLIRKYGEETIVWASYLLYGDPTFNYIDQVEGREEPLEEPEDDAVAGAASGVRSPRDTVTFGREETEEPKRMRWAAGAVGILAALVIALYFGVWGQGADEELQAAMAAYRAGDYAKTIEVCNRIRQDAPDEPLPSVLLGKIAIRNGRLDEAGKHFEAALTSSEEGGEYRTDALMGLGRVASLQGRKKEALEYYHRAASVDGSDRAYLSQALLLEGQGRYGLALEMLGKVKGAEGGNQALSAFAKETQERASITKDGEKQKRIDTLIQDLISRSEAGRQTNEVEDAWTSGVLSVWLMDFETQGFGVQEGQERILSAGIVDQVLQKSRARVVERAVLDKLLEELRLGSSKLADRATALSLGRIMAARLILSGHIIHSGEESQVTIRMIETETGQVKGAVTEAFKADTPSSVMSERLSAALLGKLKELYPLRGRVDKVEEGRITLNIGQVEGVRVGQRFKTLKEGLALEIVDVLPETSVARVTDEGDGKKIEEGLRIQAI